MNPTVLSYALFCVAAEWTEESVMYVLYLPVCQSLLDNKQKTMKEENTVSISISR